ncbi:LacI family DNA-binding transcriptional regulator [Bosea rubneri]|uniref:LacI family DNA-binding transcriptional regulator n=1 Tax=Bosea rubneri TaxID=3075434 RepID=A0ABU3S921_9HYPH|nr:LacI family DNA-binding transcriptional regulator [Bosea sp. ZW T0_25]MDU0341283.1 LacI family DNA-binding transcriptional regulator [Bosea sp. ZW T0_25]
MDGRRIKLSDVARDAGVSPATVSRAIAQPELVSPETLAKVMASAQRLGYLPDGAARALASGRSMTIGAIVPTLDSAIFARALQAMQATLAQSGYLLLVASHEASPAAETQAVRALLGRGVDGLMLVGAERAPETTALLRASGVPVVLTWCGDGHFASVAIDNVLAGRLAAEHLIALGHRRIGMITGPLHFNDRQTARLAGARQALAEAGLSLPDQLVTEQALTLAGGRAGCATLLELDDKPTALIGGVDLLAIGCIEEAHARGMNVPGDLAVVGIDGLDMSAHISPSLTTVHLPTGRIGQFAAMKLMALVRREAIEQHTVLPVELIVRRSAAGAS